MYSFSVEYRNFSIINSYVNNFIRTDFHDRTPLPTKSIQYFPKSFHKNNILRPQTNQLPRVAVLLPGRRQ